MIEYNLLRDALDTLEMERDLAVSQLRALDKCEHCTYYTADNAPDNGSEPHCKHITCVGWEWRGVQNDNERGDKND